MRIISCYTVKGTGYSLDFYLDESDFKVGEVCNVFPDTGSVGGVVISADNVTKVIRVQFSMLPQYDFSPKRFVGGRVERQEVQRGSISL